MSHYIALGSTFIPCPKSYNQTRLGLEFQIKRNPYTKRILITKENIKLSPVTDRDTATNQSASSALFFRVIGRPPVTAIGKHRHWSSARIRHHFWTWSYPVVSHRQPPLSATPLQTGHHCSICQSISINSRCASKDTCPKTVSTHAPQFRSIKSLMLQNSLQ